MALEVIPGGGGWAAVGKDKRNRSLCALCCSVWYRVCAVCCGSLSLVPPLLPLLGYLLSQNRARSSTAVSLGGLCVCWLLCRLPRSRVAKFARNYLEWVRARVRCRINLTLTSTNPQKVSKLDGRRSPSLFRLTRSHHFPAFREGLLGSFVIETSNEKREAIRPRILSEKPESSLKNPAILQVFVYLEFEVTGSCFSECFLFC